jgi:hypothetical protein
LSYKWITAFFLVLFGYFVIGHIGDVKGSADCDRQTYSPVVCTPSPSSEDKGTESDVGDESGNIEEQIPSVIPFP